MMGVHATPNRNLPTIKRLGLVLPPNGIKRLWFTSSELIMTTWIDHIAKHQQTTRDQMSILHCELDDDAITRCCGEWYGIVLYYRPVPPQKIIRIFP